MKVRRVATQRKVQARRSVILVTATIALALQAPINSGAAGPSKSFIAYQRAVAAVNSATSQTTIPKVTTPSLSQHGKGNYAFITSPKIKWTCIPAKTATKFEICKFGKIGSSRKMVLLGDSQASAWAAGFIKYAELNNIELSLLAMNSCPPWHLPITDANGQIFPSCNKFQAFAQQQINALRPNYVLITGVIPLTTGGARPTVEQMSAGVSSLIRSLRPSGAKVAVLSNNPMYYANAISGPPNCYFSRGTEIDQCALVPSAIYVSGTSNGTLRTALQTGAAAANAPYVNMEPLLCASKCPVVIDSYLVYHDSFHVYWTYAEHLALPLGYLLNQAVKAPTL